MPSYGWLAIFVVAVAAFLVIVLWPQWRAARLELRRMRARDQFRLERERLELRFVALALQQGPPRGFASVEYDFENEVAWARDRVTGALHALVAVWVRLEPAADAEAAGVASRSAEFRAATAVFRHDGKHWTTDGRTVYNLSPDETIHHFHDQLEATD